MVTVGCTLRELNLEINSQIDHEISGGYKPSMSQLGWFFFFVFFECVKRVPTGGEQIRPTVSEVSPPPEDGGNPLEDLGCSDLTPHSNV